MRKQTGLALLTPARRREIASLGGETSQGLGYGHRFTPATASDAGRLGGRPTTVQAAGLVPWTETQYDALIARKKEELIAAADTVARIERTIVAFERAKAGIYGGE